MAFFSRIKQVRAGCWALWAACGASHTERNVACSNYSARLVAHAGTRGYGKAAQIIVWTTLQQKRMFAGLYCLLADCGCTVWGGGLFIASGAANSQWVFQTSLDVTCLLLLIAGAWLPCT
jgi:hypothetical protein